MRPGAVERSKPMSGRRRPISEASLLQRIKVREMRCLVCGLPAEAAHLIDRSLTAIGQDDPKAVVPLCRGEHRAYDDGDLDILPYLEPHFRDELAYAVERIGLLPTLKRVTNRRWVTT